MDLLEAWRNWEPSDGPPYVLDMDVEALNSRRWQKKTVTFTREQAAKDDALLRSLEDRRLHLGLFPFPFIGDLKNASIYVLMANPGLNLSDYDNVTDGDANWLRGQLRQEFGDSLPFGTAFDPKNVEKGGEDYTRDKLKQTVKFITEHSARSYSDTLKEFASKLAVIQLVPYHSKKFVSGAHMLPSADLAVKFVEETVVPRVRNGEAILIVTRRIKDWNRNQGLPRDLVDAGFIVLYDRPGEPLSASLGPRSRGGKAILRQFGIPTRD